MRTVLLSITVGVFGSLAQAETIAIVGGTVIDGNGGAPVPGGVIIIHGERITTVGGRDTHVPREARKVDARGMYVIPGLMDANVHLVYGFSTEYLVRFENRFEDIIKEASQIALKSGVTTVFDTWGPLDALKAVRDEINHGKLEASRIFLAGNIIGLGGPFTSDFYASTQSVSADTVRRINGMYEQGTGHDLIYMGPDEVRSIIRTYLSRDVDFLKYAVSGHGGRSRGFLLFSPGVQSVIIDEARRRGLTVQTHTTSIESLRMAVDAGVDLMQHCNLTARYTIPDELVRRIADRKIPCAMQMFPKRYLSHVAGESAGTEAGGVSAESRSANNDSGQLFAIMTINRQKLIAAGATIVMATDGGVPYQNDPLLQEVFFQRTYPQISEDIVGFFGKGHAAWLRGAHEAGLSPMKVLQAATRNVAAAYRKLDSFGTLEAGKIADLVVLDGDPLADPANYGAIHLVIKAGIVVDREALPTTKVLTQCTQQSERAC